MTSDSTSMSPLSSQLMEAIKQAEGCLPFHEFMTIALYSEGSGYYNNPSSPFGKAGDFITAPMISPYFATCLAKQFAELQTQHQLTNIIEIGAGDGTLACQLLQQCRQDKLICQHYYIIEISQALIEKQKQYLSKHLPHDLFETIRWCSLETLPNTRALVIGNEVLDAMPVHCFEINEQGITEQGVGLREQAFVWQSTPHSNPQFHEHVQAIQQTYQLSPPYHSEVCLFMIDWLQTLAQTLEQAVVLFIDYGFPGHEYYHPDRNQGTLMCHQQHHAHPDPLVNVGQQDITAHVDFTAVAMAAEHAGFDVIGYLEQSRFLLNLGITDHFDANTEALDEVTRLQVTQGIKKLTLPHEMGELFKVIALSKGLANVSLQGFRSGNKLMKL